MTKVKRIAYRRTNGMLLQVAELATTEGTRYEVFAYNERTGDGRPYVFTPDMMDAEAFGDVGEQVLKSMNIGEEARL